MYSKIKVKKFGVDENTSDINSKFSTTSEIPVWNPVHCAYIIGYPDGSFRLDAAITRAEFATIMNRVLERVPQAANDLLSDMVVWADNRDTNRVVLYSNAGSNKFA